MRISDWSSDVCSSDLNARALERQTAFTRGVGQSLHPPVKEITTAVEHDLLDAGRHGALGHQLAALGSRGLVGAVLQLVLQGPVKPGLPPQAPSTALVPSTGRVVFARPDTRPTHPP